MSKRGVPLLGSSVIISYCFFKCHTVDERNPPPKIPKHDSSPVNANKQSFLMVS